MTLTSDEKADLVRRYPLKAVVQQEKSDGSVVSIVAVHGSDLTEEIRGYEAGASYQTVLQVLYATLLERIRNTERGATDPR